ncbi:MAG TPA: integrase arm-type DNA-binding domain-containing protein, partial [Steroidobacteraceae bacterium]|nr:integrase arm-type DNA-binding domain-containing protein [Steroidobacteraceae bacterium]
MGKVRKQRVTGVTEKTVSGWERTGQPFERSVGDGLTLTFRKGYADPVWRLRYRFANTPRVMVLGSRKRLTLADARRTADKLLAGITANGKDPATEARENTQADLAKIQATRAGAYTVSDLLDDYLKQYATKTVKVRQPDGRLATVKVPRWKHPEIVHARIERDIRPELGEIPVDEVKVHHVQVMLNKIVERGARTTANDVLRWTRKIFDYAINQEKTTQARNPANQLTDEEAGGEESARDRKLSPDEIVKFFAAMRKTPGFSIQNFHTFKLLLLLAVRKSELVMARVDEFDLKAAIWKLPVGRTKTEAAIDIPLPAAAVKALRELVRLGEGSDYLLPARKAQDR